MLTFIYGHDLDARPILRDSMFRDRAAQFRGQLGWPVSVDAKGWEQDEYDAENPLYVIWERADGRHGGSARFLPTTGRTMVNDHFVHLAGGVAFHDPLIWECTRFWLAPGADARVAPALMLGGGGAHARLWPLAPRRRVRHLHDPRLQPSHRRGGPDVLGGKTASPSACGTRIPRADSLPGARGPDQRRRRGLLRPRLRRRRGLAPVGLSGSRENSNALPVSSSSYSWNPGWLWCPVEAVAASRSELRRGSAHPASYAAAQCPGSAPMRQTGAFHERRMSGSS